MLKRYIGISVLVVLLIVLATIRTEKKEEKNIEQGENIRCEEDSVPDENIALEKEETVFFAEGYRILDRSIFDDGMISWYNDETKLEIEAYAESVKGDLEQVWEEDSMFPQELVNAMEEMIYQSLDKSLDKFEWEEIQKSVYYSTTNRFGADDLNPDLEEMKELFPELKDTGIELSSVFDAYKKVSGTEECHDMFPFHITPEQDNYLFVMDSGGSAGHAMIQTAELKNGEFRIMNEFETQNSGHGRVIQYEEQFYYVFLPYNYNLKNYDGVRLYKLGNDPAQENLLIRYLPYSYKWKNIYNTSEGIELGSYIESIKKDITDDEYLENGRAGDIAVYYGDEEAVDILLPDNKGICRSVTCHQIDFMNVGLPVYIKKSNFIPSNYRSKWHLKSRFYMQQSKDGSVMTLENMEINHDLPDPLRPELVQMWFKEMEGKVYTFCLYHVSDYNYMLNVVRLEGEEVNRIRTDILSPRRHFVLTEGERTVYF